VAIGWKSEFSLADLPVRGVKAYCALCRSSAYLSSTPCFAPPRSCCNTSILSLNLIKFVLWPFNIHVAWHFIPRNLIPSRLMLYQCTFILGICTLVTRCEFSNYISHTPPARAGLACCRGGLVPRFENVAPSTWTCCFGS
jgi:hypothetical protein